MASPSKSDQFPSSEMFDTLVRIEVGVGEDKQSFDVYHGVLCFYSGYFKAALNGSWRESQDQLIRLPEDDPKLFQYLTNWIHMRCFYESTLDPSILMTFLILAKLWILADVLGIPMLQNELVDFMLKKFKAFEKYMDEDTVEYIWNNTSEHSPLRRLVCASVWTVVGDARDHIDLDGFPKLDSSDHMNLEYYKLLLKRLEDECLRQPIHSLHLSTSPQWRCEWHIHADGVECRRTDS